METLMNNCTLFPILSGVGGALLGGFIIWAWQQLRLQKLMDQFQTQTNLLELTKGEKDQLNKRHRELQEKMSVFRTREYQLTGEVTEWRDNFIAIEHQYKSLKEQLVNKERELEDIKSSISNVEIAQESNFDNPLEYEDDIMGQMPIIVEIPEAEKEKEEDDFHEEEEEEEALEIEATANSDGTTSTKEGIITSDSEKEELQELEYYLLEKQQLAQKIEEITKEKLEEIERWAQKYQGLQIKLSDLQQQIDLSSTVSSDLATLETKYQRALEDLGVAQTQYRLLEQEKLKILQEKDRASSDWQARYEELQQHYQTIQAEVTQLQNQLNETAKTANEQQITLATLAPQEDWEQRYKNVVAQFINAKERIKGLEINKEENVANATKIEEIKASVEEKNLTIERLEAQINDLIALDAEKEQTHQLALEVQIGIVNEKQQLLNELETKIIAQISENQNIAAELTQTKTALQLLQQQFQASHQHIDQLESLKHQLEIEKTDLSADYQSLVQQFQASQRHIDELETALNDLKMAEANWQAAKTQLEQKWSNQYEATIIQYNDAIDQLNDLKQGQQDLILSNQQKEQARIRLSEELNATQQAFNAQVNANSKLEEEVIELRGLYEEASQQLSHLLQEKKTLIVEKEKLETQDYKELYETLLAQQEAYQKSIDELEEELYRNKNA